MYERDVNEIKKLLSKSRRGDIDFNSLTEEEKMNIRKNLELYYKTRGEGEISITYNFITDEPLDTIEIDNNGQTLTCIKISDTYIPSENLKHIYISSDEIPINIVYENEDGYIVGPLLAVNKDNGFVNNLGPFSKGLWIPQTATEGADLITISYIGETDIYEKVPKEYLPDDIYPFNVTIVETAGELGSSYTSDTNFLSLKDAIINGRDIKIDLSDGQNIIGCTKNVSFINNEIYIDFSKSILILDSDNIIQFINGHSQETS